MEPESQYWKKKKIFFPVVWERGIPKKWHWSMLLLSSKHMYSLRESQLLGTPSTSDPYCSNFAHLGTLVLKIGESRRKSPVREEKDKGLVLLGGLLKIPFFLLKNQCFKNEIKKGGRENIDRVC